MRQLCPPSMKCYWIYRLTWLTFLFIIALCLTWSLGYNHCFQQLTRHPHPPRHHHHQQQQVSCQKSHLLIYTPTVWMIKLHFHLLFHSKNISGCEDELLTVKVIHSGGPKVNSDFASAPNENANVQGEEKDDEDEDDDAIDAVYTWVNGSDEQLLNNLIKYRSQVLVGNNLTLYSYLEGWRYHKKCITLISSPKEAEGKVRSSEGKRRRRRRNAAGINLTHPSSVSYDAISDEDEDEDASVRIKASSTQSDASRIEELGPMNGRTGASESQKAFPSDAASTSHKSKDFSSSSRIRAGGRGGGGGERGRKKRTAGEGSYYYEEIPLAISLDDHRVTPDSGHSYSTSDHKLHFGGSKGKSDDLNSPGENKSQSDSSFNLHFLPQSHQMLTKRVTICQNIHCHKENASLVYLQSAIDLGEDPRITGREREREREGQRQKLPWKVKATRKAPDELLSLLFLFIHVHTCSCSLRWLLLSSRFSFLPLTLPFLFLFLCSCNCSGSECEFQQQPEYIRPWAMASFPQDTL